MKFKTIEEMGKEIAERALDEYKYNGKTIREWADILSKENCVEVVRCKDCKFYKQEYSDDYFRCQIFQGAYEKGFPTEEDDFCIYGERKEK